MVRADHYGMIGMATWMGVLALEVGDAATQSRLISRAGADALTPRLLGQIGRLLPAEHPYGFSWAAALYDPAQVLRRGFPVHVEIQDLFLAGREKGLDIGQSLCLMQHQGHMPTRVLEPDAELGAGILQVIPVVLTGSDEAIDAARETLESSLYEQGLVDAGSALSLSEDLGSPLQHVRWMSLLDMAAMMAAQLEHVGLAPAWELIEEQLFAPRPRELEVTSALGLPMRLDSTGLHVGFLPFAVFARARPDHSGSAALDDWLGLVHEFRQLQALFAAHAMAPLVPGEQDGFLTETHSEGPSVRYRLHTHPALGALAWSGFDARGALVEHRYPLSTVAIERFIRQLRSADVAVESVRVSLAADGRDLA